MKKPKLYSIEELVKMSIEKGEKMDFSNSVRYLKTAIQKIGNKQFKLDELPKHFDTYVEIDHFIVDFEKKVLTEFEANYNADVISYYSNIIQLLVIQFEEKKLSSFDNLETDNYFTKKLLILEKKINLYKTIKPVRIEPIKSENSNNQIESFGLLTIEEIKNILISHSSKFKNIDEFEYGINQIKMFFSNSNYKPQRQIFIQNGAIKTLGYSLGEIWREQINGRITNEYLNFCKSLFSIFHKQIIPDNEVVNCNMRKYFTNMT